MLGFWSTLGFLFTMDQGWKKLSLFVIFLISLKNAHGYKGGAYSNAYHQLGPPSDNTFSPHAVQSSVSEVPVTGTLPKEVGSSLFPNRGSQKQFTSTGTQERSSSPFYLQGRTPSGLSRKSQGTTSQFAPSVSLSSKQGAVGQSATVQSSRKQFTSSSGALSGSSIPFSLQGSTSYGGSLKPQATTSQFTPGSPSSFNCHCESLSSPQDVASVSATVQSLQKQFTNYGLHSQSGSSTPFSLQGSTSYGGSLQPQATTSQFAPASQSYNCHCVSVSLPQDVASQSNQASQSYSVSQRWKPSQGISTSGAVVSQGSSSLSQSSPMQSRFSSLSSAGGSSGDSGQFVSAQDGSTSYGGLLLHSQSPSSKYIPGSHAYAKLGYPPLAVSSQSISDQRSNGLYRSDSLRTQGLLGVVERTSRLSSQAPSDSPVSKKISERFVTQHLTGSKRAPFLGLSAQASSVGMFSGIPQTAQALRESGSDVQLYNQPFLKPLLLRQGQRGSTKTAS